MSIWRNLKQCSSFLHAYFCTSFIFCFYIYLFFFPCFVSSSLPFSIMITFCSFHSSFPSSSVPACYQSSSATTRHSSCHSLALARIHFTPLFHVHTSFHQPCPPSPLLVTADNNVQWGSSSASWLHVPHSAEQDPNMAYWELRITFTNAVKGCSTRW